VEQLGTDSDCVSGAPSSSNPAGTSFTLEIKDATAGWLFSTTQTGSGFTRSSAEAIAEASSSCTLLFCSEVPLADFGQVNYSGSAAIDTAGTKGSLSAFNANEITMVDNGTTLATPTSLSSDGSSFSVNWNNS
jgi:peptidase A4-like protein